jgi:phage portal protein BeeE
MAWYDRILGRDVQDQEKLNPAQSFIGMDEGMTIDTREIKDNYRSAYEELEVVNRAVNMIVDDSADIKYDVGNKVNGITPVVDNVRRTRVDLLLNKEPNPFQDVNTFKRNLIIDLLIDGNIFVYFDGRHLYHLPAQNVTIHSIYRGTPRLKPAYRTMYLLDNMRKFQDNFFKNGAVPGLVLKSPNTLSDRIKERMLQSWSTRYNPKNGGKRPLILDGGLEVDSLTKINFKELDFQSSIQANEKVILEAMGVPPILLDGGNNANIRPNHRLYYLETILPIVRKMSYAFERYFGFELSENVTDIPALQPELRDQAAYYATLVNTGIMTPNEARDQLGREPLEGHDELRVPANIAGSAANPTEGGQPPQEEEQDNGE